MTAEFYLAIGLGFFAGLSVGLIATIVLTVFWIRALQTKMVGETVNEIMDELGMSEDVQEHDDQPDPDDLHEEWWKRGKR